MIYLSGFKLSDSIGWEIRKQLNKCVVILTFDSLIPCKRKLKSDEWFQLFCLEKDVSYFQWCEFFSVG